MTITRKATNRDWSSLPFEILTIIFKNLTGQYVGSHDIGQCALTCQGWNLAAQTLFFSTVTIKKKADINDLPFRLTTRKHVRTLEYNCSRNDISEDELQLLKLAHIFPSLESIEFEDTTESVYEAIYQLLKRGELPYLNSIGYPTSQRESEAYLKCVLHLKDRLTYITVSTMEDEALYREHCIGPIIYNELSSKLDSFPNLISIRISNTFSGINNVEDFVESIIPISNTHLNYLRLFFTRSNKGTPTVHSTSNKGQMQPLNNVKSLELLCDKRINIGDEESLLYVMKKFPKLRSLKLRTDMVYRLRSGKAPAVKLSLSTVNQFLHYLFKMSYCSVRDLVTDLNTSDILYQLYSQLPTKPHTNKLTIVVDTGAEQEDMGHKARTAIKLTGISSNSFSTSIRVTALVTPSEFGQEEEGTTRFDVIEKVGKFVDVLHLHGYYSEERTVFPTLSRLAEYCVRLKELHLFDIDTGFFDLWKKKIEENRSSMKTLFIGSDTLDESIFMSIAASFPFLEHINIKYDTIRNNPGNDYPTIDENIPNYIMMPMFGLSLKKMVLRTASGFMDQSKISFKLVTGNFQSSYFSLIFLPGPRKMNHIPGSHYLEEITEQEYEDSIEDLDCFTFYIICNSLEEIEMEYRVDTEPTSFKTVHFLSELAQNKSSVNKVNLE